MSSWFNKIKKIVVTLNALSLCILTSCGKRVDYTEVTNRLQAREYHNKKFKISLPYRLFIPGGYKTSKKYPLILILHASGVQGTDNMAQIGYSVAVFSDQKIQGKHPCFILAPQCPKGSQWVNTTFKKMPFDNYNQDAIPESDAMKMVVSLISELTKEFSIDKKRIYVTGSSMGGSGTWDIITRHPDLFAAAMPLTGVSDPTKAKYISDMAIWAFHGAKDGVSPVHVTKNMIAALIKYGSKCRFTEYEKLGHDVINATYNNPEVIEWLFNQKK